MLNLIVIFVHFKKEDVDEEAKPRLKVPRTDATFYILNPGSKVPRNGIDLCITEAMCTRCRFRSVFICFLIP